MNEQNADSYHFWEERNVKHPTTDFETSVHVVKGCFGIGIFAMPRAFAHTGLLGGVVLTATAGTFCTYGVHQLVKCAQILCQKHRKPALQYAEVTLYAFKSGTPRMQRCAETASTLTKYTVAVFWTAVCCVYVVFASVNIKLVIEQYTGYDMEIRAYTAALWFPLVLLVSVRHLKYTAIFSSIANLLNLAALAITFYYVIDGLPSPMDRPMLPSSLLELPEFFSIVIFAVEGVGVILPLENNMKSPKHFNGCCGVLNLAMISVVSMYTLVGFFGYLRFGSDAKNYGSITHNLPSNEGLAQSVNLLLAMAVFLTYSLQFYVPMEIFWTTFQDRFSEKRKQVAEFCLRVIIVTVTVIVAIIVPDLGVIISLLGAICLSTLGLIIPCILDIVTGWESPGFGRYYWILIKNIIVLAFGLMAFVTGTGISVRDLIKYYRPSDGG